MGATWHVSRLRSFYWCVAFSNTERGLTHRNYWADNWHPTPPLAPGAQRDPEADDETFHAIAVSLKPDALSVAQEKQ